MITSKSKSVLKRGTSGIVAAALSLPIIAAASPFDASAAKEKYKYGLFINNVQVEESNADDILGNGVFSYNASSKTLTIDGDYEFGSLGGVGAIRNTDIEGLTVYTASDSYLATVDDCFVVDKTTIFTGPGTLNITAGNCDGTTSSKTGIYAQLIEGTVSFKNATVNINADAGYWGNYDSSKGTCTVVFIRDSDININATNKAFAAAKNINLIDSYIASPATYYLDTVNSNTIKEKTDDGYTDAKNVSIRSDGNFYGMKIAGVPVTNANKGDILGDGVFEYLPESKTLLVNGNIETDYTVIDVDNTVASNYDIYPLTIDVQKNSTLTGNKHGGIHLSNGETTITGGGSLSIKAPTATGIGLLEDATLNISGADIDIDAEYGITGNAEFVGGTEESLILTDSDIHIKVPDGNPAISQMRGQGIVNHGYSFSGMNLGVQTEKWGSEWTEYFGKMDGSYASEITLTRQDCQIEKYDLYIDGVQVNQYNADDILGNGVFSYDIEKQELWIEGGFKSKSRDNDLIKSKLEHSLSIYATRNVKLENDNQTYTLNSYNNGPVYITEYTTNNGITMCTLSIGGELTIEDTTLNVLGDSQLPDSRLQVLPGHFPGLVRQQDDNFVRRPFFPFGGQIAQGRLLDELRFTFEPVFAVPIFANIVFATPSHSQDGNEHFSSHILFRIQIQHLVHLAPHLISHPLRFQHEQVIPETEQSGIEFLVHPARQLQDHPIGRNPGELVPQAGVDILAHHAQ